jgi:two-component sensor histidine kinase
VLAYDERGRFELPPEGIPFPANQLAPSAYLAESKRTTRLVLALHFKAEPIGFVVFELLDDADTSLCETLRWQLSSALKGASLMLQQRTVASEKETLLRELQHRVKNSIAVISSIVGIESRASESPETRGALERIGSRIAALGALYDTLYDTGSIERIDLALYLELVIDSAAESLGTDTRGIAIDRSIGHCSIDLKRAVSLGLIVNELVTDSLKHAFPDGRSGRVSVALECAAGKYRLEVSDDGVGLPQGFDPERDRGFGLNLVSLLVKQLDGELAFESRGGARVAIAFGS